MEFDEPGRRETQIGGVAPGVLQESNVQIYSSLEDLVMDEVIDQEIALGDLPGNEIIKEEE